MPEYLVFSCAKIFFLVSLLFVAVKDRLLFKAGTWFLEIAFVQEVSMCVHVCV